MKPFTRPADKRRLRVQVDRPLNQDATIVKLLMSEELGGVVRQYVAVLDWTEYSGFDLLDVSSSTFAGEVQVSFDDRADQPSGSVS